MNNKQYLISFLATMQGEKLVISQMRQLEKSQTGLKTVTQATTKANLAQSASYARLAMRAIAVIPIWMALRTVYMGIINTITGMIKAHFDLEEGLARIRTVVHGTTAEIESQMIVIKREILDMAVRTKIPIKELAEVFYFLRTSALTTEEAIAAFTPTVNAMVGTGIKAKEMARAIAGSFHTMGKFMDETLTSAEKLTRIADILTYTYATQDVEMSELVAGYSKLAPYVSGLEDSFLDMVTTLGFLNTQMLRGGRTGRLLGRSVLQLVKNSSQLASIFGITFEPDKPIRFLDVIKKISESMAVTGKLTERQTAALNKIFATRGGVPIRLMVASFEELTEAIEKAEENAEGFAKKIAEIRMDTVQAQMSRMKNVLHVLFEEFISATVNAGDFIEAIKNINDSLNTIRPIIQAFGYQIGWVGYNLAQLLLLIEQIGTIQISPKDLLNPFVALQKYIEKFREAAQNVRDMELDLIGPTEYMEKRIKVETEIWKKRKEQEKINEKAIKDEKELSETKIYGEKEEKEYLTHKINLMKILGAHQLDIARMKLEETKLNEITTESEQYKLDLLKAQNEVVEERTRYARELSDIVQEGQINVLKAMGANELQILQVKMAQINSNKFIKNDSQKMLDLAKLRVQTQIALNEAKQKELDKAKELYRQYHEAGQAERERLQRLAELLKMRPEEVSRQWQYNMFDRRIIDEYFDYFNQKQREAVDKAIQLKYPEFKIKIIPEPTEIEIPRTTEREFAEVYPEEKVIAAERERERREKEIERKSYEQFKRTGRPEAYWEYRDKEEKRDLERKTKEEKDIYQQIIETYRDEMNKTRDDLKNIHEKESEILEEEINLLEKIKKATEETAERVGDK